MVGTVPYLAYRYDSVYLRQARRFTCQADIPLRHYCFPLINADIPF